MSELCVGIRGVDSLKHELDRTRESLRDTDATIEKLTGRPLFAGRPFARRGGPPRPIGGESIGPRSRLGGNSSLFGLAGYDDAGPPPAKRVAGAFGRLGLPVSGQRSFASGRRTRDEDDEDELSHRPSLQSSVIATPRDTKSRLDAIAEQQSGAGGAAGTARNRRMFGLLLGTLVKFKQDERTKEQQAEKRKAVELNVEEKQREERDRLKRERFQLFSDRRRHQAKLRALEQKMELVEIHSAWESETHSLENFIRTATKPHVFFLPKSHIPASQAKFDESKRVLRELIAERRKQLEEDLEEIMKEDKDDGNELMEEHGHSGSENEENEVYVHSDIEADNSEMVDADTNEHKDKSQKKTANEESDLDESDMVGVDYEQSLAAESHNVSATNESLLVEVTEEVTQETEKTVADKDASNREDLQSHEAPHADYSKKDLSDSDASEHEGKTDVQHDDSKRREKHKVDERRRERKRRDSSRSGRHIDKRRSHDRKRDKDRDRRHSRSEHRRDRHADSGAQHHKHRHQEKDSYKRKPQKKAREDSGSESESGDKLKHDDTEKSP